MEEEKKPHKVLTNKEDLVAYIKKSLEADAEQQVKLGEGDLSHESQSGVTLNLSHCSIRHLPVEAILLIRDRVERIALSHNQQVTIPSEIAQCHRLRYLNLRWNHLSHFPEPVLRLVNLEILDLSRNEIPIIPEEIKQMTSLKFLAIARNHIKRLPLSLGDMTSLSKLKFDDNPIEFPPPDVYKGLYPDDESGKKVHPEKEKEICQKVKRFLKTASMRERVLRTNPRDDGSETNMETPRPPKRSATFGRFPIRPSMSNADASNDSRSDSPSDYPAPPIPQRSHARGESGLQTRRPGIAPLRVDGDDMSRSRSETVSSSASVRQRRQGYLMPRQRTGDLNSLSEESARFSEASTLNSNHTRATSSVSTVNSVQVASGGEASSTHSPPGARFEGSRKLINLPGRLSSKSQLSNTFKMAKRLLFVLHQVGRPFEDIAPFIRSTTSHNPKLDNQLSMAQIHIKELDRLLNRLKAGRELTEREEEEIMKSFVRISTRALKTYSEAACELKSNMHRIRKSVDRIYIRNLMMQLSSFIVETRNVLELLGFKLKHRPAPRLTPKAVSQAWSSRTVTPIQVDSRRNRRGAPQLQRMESDATLRPPHSARLPTNIHTDLAVRDPNDPDAQFFSIYAKMQKVVQEVLHPIPHVRLDFFSRKERAEKEGDNRLVHQWSVALSKSQAVAAGNEALKDCLERIPGGNPRNLRHAKHFWAAWDQFVQAWLDLIHKLKEFKDQGYDTGLLSRLMAHAHKLIKLTNSMVENHIYYRQAMGKVEAPPINPLGLVSPLPPDMRAAFPILPNMAHGGYNPQVTATPLSAALGPAVQATVATTPSTAHFPREHYPDPPMTSRMVRDRNDTPVQQSGYPRR